MAYRPLRGGPRLVPLISAIGMSIFLQNYVQLGQGARDVSVPVLISGALELEMGGDFTERQILQIMKFQAFTLTFSQ